MNKQFRFTISAALLAASSFAFAGPITLTQGVSSSTLMEDFSSMPGSQSAFYDGNGVNVAESFVGLSVNDPGGSGFETYTGTPVANPLSLDVGAASDGVWKISGVAGLAGGTGGGDIGEGVLAMLFDGDILELGISLNGASAGSGDTTFFFYNSAGSLVDTITTALINDLTISSTQVFRGVAIQNTDGGGQAYGNLRFDITSSAPEPASMALFGLGLVGLGLRRKKKVA